MIVKCFVCKWILPITTLLTIPGCGLINPEETKQDKTVSLNPKLKQVLYWGSVDPKNTEPNTGVSFGPDIRFPLWITDSKLYCYTGQLKNGTVIKGVFSIDLNHFDFQGLTPNEFPYAIWSLGFDSNRKKLFTLYTADGVRFKASYVTASDNQTIADEEIVGEDWNPFGVTHWPGKPGVVFYGQHPQTGLKGFYWRYPDTGDMISDSLLYVITINQQIARGSSISSDGKYLFFGTESGNPFAPQTQFMKLDICRTGQNAIVMVEREGKYRTTSPNPVDPRLLLINYDFSGDAVNPPQSHIELLNIETLEAIDLDVRTHIYPSRFTTNEYPSWSRDGRHFVFSAGAFDGEGGRYLLDLWIYENVP